MGKIVKIKHTVDYYIKISDDRLAEGDALGAISAIRSGIDALPKSEKRDSLYIVLGQLYFGIELYDISNYYLYKAYHIAPLRACACFCIGRNLIKLKRYDVADLYFARCLDYDTAYKFTDFVAEWISYAKREAPKHNLQTCEERMLTEAKLHLSAKDYPAALQVLAQLPGEHPFLEETLYLEASAYFLTGDLLSARESAKALLRLNPESVLGYCLLINICHNEEDQHSLEQNLNTLLELPAETKQEIYRVALTLARCGKHKDCKPYFDKLLELDEYNVKALFFYSVACYQAGETDNALFHISRAKWIDYDNKILDFFYNFYRQGIAINFPEYVFQLPADIARSKLEELERCLKQGEAVNTLINTSHFLLDDIEWSFSLHSAAITAFVAEKLDGIKNKKTDLLMHHALINNFNTDRQKYEVLRQRFLSGSGKTIDFVADYRYRSLKPTVPGAISLGCTYRQAYIDASCFTECFAPDYNLDKTHKKVFPLIAAAPYLDIGLPVLTCLILSEQTAVLAAACRFFKSEESKVEELRKLLKMY
ncbi:MAG: hypothetical protein FWE53_01955 [Firmicutes bacterium]|nr:hypothetical protein [Bacillota bacterium]